MRRASEPDTATIFLTHVFGAATLGLGIAALLARDQVGTTGGLSIAYGLALYNVLAACLIVWTAVTLGGASLWGTGLFHALIGMLFVLALLR